MEDDLNKELFDSRAEWTTSGLDAPSCYVVRCNWIPDDAAKFYCCSHPPVDLGQGCLRRLSGQLRRKRVLKLGNVAVGNWIQASRLQYLGRCGKRTGFDTTGMHEISSLVLGPGFWNR